MTDTTLTSTTTDNRSPEEIERDIRATQEDMSRTVEQIGGELNARNILNSLLDKAEDGGIDARFFLDNARRNPLALGMIAIGGLWLVSDADARPSALGFKRSSSSHANDSVDDDAFANSGSSSRSRGSFWNRSAGDWHPDHRRYVDHMSSVVPQADEDDAAYRRRRDLARANYFMIEQGHDEDHGAFRQRLDAATETARSTWSKTGETAQGLARSVQDRGRSMAGDVQEFYADNPLLLGLGAAFLGAVAGAMFPATRTEEQYVGSLGEQALGAADEQVRKVGQAARRAKDDMLAKIDEKAGTQSQESNRGTGQETGDMSTGVGQNI